VIGFIVNPVSGNGRGAAVWSKLESVLKKRNTAYVVEKTAKMGDAKQLTIEMLTRGEVQVLVAVGGDGTVNEVINGMIAVNTPCRFAHIAAGSGNDFARGHALPTEPIEALEKILNAEEGKAIDLLQVNGRIAANAVGAGFDGQVAKTTNEASYKKLLNRLRLGVFAYIISVIRVLFFYRPSTVWLSVDGEEEEIEGVWLIAVANIANYGGGMLICPGAAANDGIAEVCVVSKVTRWGLLRAFPLIFSGAHVNHPAVRFYRGTAIAVRTAKPLVVHADGETVGQTPISIEVLPNRLQVLK
jgi:diacylglycerol kinase (ATP)